MEYVTLQYDMYTDTIYVICVYTETLCIDGYCNQNLGQDMKCCRQLKERNNG